LTLCCRVKIVRVITVESGEVFLNISGKVWSTATKLCMRIDIVEGQVLVVKNLRHSAQVQRGKGVKLMVSYYVSIRRFRSSFACGC